jgi:hypothetical protein
MPVGGLRMHFELNLNLDIKKMAATLLLNPFFEPMFHVTQLRLDASICCWARIQHVVEIQTIQTYCIVGLHFELASMSCCH